MVCTKICAKVHANTGYESKPIRGEAGGWEWGMGVLGGGYLGRLHGEVTPNHGFNVFATSHPR